MYTYLYDPNTALYYKLTASIETGTGNITTSLEQSGVPVNPGYQPASGEPIVPLTFYLTYFNLPETSVDGNQYIVVSNSVTRYIERYTCDTWVDETVPEDLQAIGCLMIRDKINEAAKEVDTRLKSESVVNYSYTLNDNYLTKSLYTKYNDELDMFRVLPFA
jgi:hypothetical protein